MEVLREGMEIEALAEKRKGGEFRDACSQLLKVIKGAYHVVQVCVGDERESPLFSLLHQVEN